ncbi:MAG: RluA family pseudouridine synthase [Planctomycetota bacterium]|jgi:23S rRNA pseudouridine955/2504/2580 synthase|nr:RluA family pseudouridine synthase [Planctomycetota bacterium]
MPDLLLPGAEPDFAAVAKPPGIETVSAAGAPDAVSLARNRLGWESALPVHRLDRDTSGALLVARTPEAEKELTRLFRERLVVKRYLAISLGAPFNRSGVINRNLSDWDGGRRPVRVVKGNGGLEASTDYRVVAVGPDSGFFGREAGLIVFSPHQGRTHQIRVHAAALGHPLLGDDRYGDRVANKAARDRLGIRRQALHSWRLAFPWKGGRKEVVCDPPPDLARAMELLFGEGIRGLLEKIKQTAV